MSHLALPVAPPEITLSWQTRTSGKRELALRHLRGVLKHGDEFWGVSCSSHRLAAVYLKRAKAAGWTVVLDPKGLA